MLIDKNNILCTSEHLSQDREFSQTVEGYTFSDYDKKLLVLHKKQLKEINLKDLGNKMSIFYMYTNIKDRHISNHFDLKSFWTALALFSGFDEETGEKYYFFPKIPQNKLEEINTHFNKLGFTEQIKYTEKGAVIPFQEAPNEYQPLTFLFVLTLIYGKLETKTYNDKTDLKGIKLHIPFFGQYLDKKEELEDLIKIFQNNGYFIKSTTQQTNDGLVLQITSQDYELLQAFAKFYEPIEKISQISKYDNILEVKKQLQEYTGENFDDKTIKILTK